MAVQGDDGICSSLTSLGPHLVHDTIATFTATDGVLGLDHILLATFW